MVDPVMLAMLHADNFAQIASVDSHGAPSVSTVWYLYSDDLLWIATTRATEKGRNMELKSPVALVITDRNDGYKQLLIKGTVAVVVDDSDMAVCDRISIKYIGRPFPHRNTPQRVGVAISMKYCKYHSVKI